MKRVTVVSLLVWFLVGGIATATPEDVANEISQTIMSPYCPGVTLHDCASGAAADLRSDIAGWAEDGWSKERILNHLEAEFGDSIRATPPSSGAGLIAWLLPALAVLVGSIAVTLIVSSWLKKRAVVAPAPISGDERKRLDAELKELGTES